MPERAVNRPGRHADSSNRTGRCALCEREVALTAHHLIPRKLHRRPRFKRLYSRSELRATVLICGACHRGLHRLFDEMHLGQYLNSLRALLAEPSVQRHCRWVARQRTR